jgi:hypothetical protein
MSRNNGVAMRKLFLPAVLLFSVLQMPAQSKKAKPVLSNEPMTAEQIEIYRAALKNYTHGADASLNLANVTRPFPPEGSFASPGKDCLHDIELLKSSDNQVFHHLDPSVPLTSKMVLVDPGKQGKKVRENDPGKTIKDSRKPLSDADVANAVATGFNNGLFTFSEILFNKSHTRAAVQYSFVCGGLCGHGGTMILIMKDGKWIADGSQYCGSWIS